jgi:hypothetical protein
MRIFLRVFWIIAFVAATFCWMVLFQHGFGWQKFTTGVQQELVTLGLAGKPTPVAP